jgi:SAM-dependent methyltransferase
VPTWTAADVDVAACVAMDAPGMTIGSEGVVLEHERVPVITYAHEWSFSMLRDAALLHLDLVEALIPAGFILKDANPANVQWREGRACLIDVSSVADYSGGPWTAYGQFCRTMLFPLMSSAWGQLPLSPLLKGHGADGMPVAIAARLLRGRASLRRGVMLHVRLQAWLHRLSEGRQGDSAGMTATITPESVLRLVSSLRRALTALPTPARTAWTAYRFTSTYSTEQAARKETVIDQWCKAHVTRHHTVLDVGCNTGDYSRLLAMHAGLVIGIDADGACIDEVYRRQLDNVLPLVVDAASPSPAAGWAYGEQATFDARIQADWSVWLAVIHHLAIHNGIRLDEVVRRIAATSPQLIVEFVAPEDAMVRALLTERGIERPDYTEQAFQALCAANGLETLDKCDITPTRALYLLKRRDTTCS